MTNLVLLEVLFRSASGDSILEHETTSSSRDFSRYEASKETQKEAVKALEKLGFKIIGPASPYGVSISGSEKLVEDVFGKEPFKIPRELERWIEQVRIPPPGKFFK